MNVTRYRESLQSFAIRGIDIEVCSTSTECINDVECIKIPLNTVYQQVPRSLVPGPLLLPAPGIYQCHLPGCISSCDNHSKCLALRTEHTIQAVNNHKGLTNVSTIHRNVLTVIDTLKIIWEGKKSPRKGKLHLATLEIHLCYQPRA